MESFKCIFSHQALNSYFDHMLTLTVSCEYCEHKESSVKVICKYPLGFKFETIWLIFSLSSVKLLNLNLQA